MDRSTENFASGWGLYRQMIGLVSTHFLGPVTGATGCFLLVGLLLSYLELDTTHAPTSLCTILNFNSKGRGDPLPVLLYSVPLSLFISRSRPPAVLLFPRLQSFNLRLFILFQ